MWMNSFCLVFTIWCPRITRRQSHLEKLLTLTCKGGFSFLPGQLHCNIFAYSGQNKKGIQTGGKNQTGLQTAENSIL